MDFSPNDVTLRVRVSSLMGRFVLRLPLRAQVPVARACVRFLKIVLPDFWVCIWWTNDQKPAQSGEFCALGNTRKEAEADALASLPSQVYGGERDVKYRVHRPNLWERLWG